MSCCRFREIFPNRKRHLSAIILPRKTRCRQLFLFSSARLCSRFSSQYRERFLLLRTVLSLCGGKILPAGFSSAHFKISILSHFLLFPSFEIRGLSHFIIFPLFGIKCLSHLIICPSFEIRGLSHFIL